MSFIPTTNNFAPSVTVYPQIDSDTYEGRIVRVIALGMQNKTKLVPNGKGGWTPSTLPQDTKPCFKLSLQIELIGMQSKGTKWELEGNKWQVKEEYSARPTCVFHDVWLYPNLSRGNFFDLLQSLDPSVTKVPADLDYFRDVMLGAPLNVTVKSVPARQSAEDAAYGKPLRYFNNIKGTAGMSARIKKGLPAAESQLVFFDCYDGGEEMQAAYAELPKFQRDMLTEATDSVNIPLAGTEPIERPAPEEQGKAPVKETPVADVEEMDFSDDIPF